LDPDKAKGIEQLLMAHDALFGQNEDDEDSDQEDDDEDTDKDKDKDGNGDHNEGNNTGPPTLKGLASKEEDQNSETDSSYSGTSSVASSTDSVRGVDGGASSSSCCAQGMDFCVQSFLFVCRQLPHPSILTWLPKYNFKRYFFQSDIVSSICISIFGIPQALAYAALIGIDPGAGLYAVIYPAVLYPIMGWSRTGAMGPMSVPCLYMGAIADELGYLPNTKERWVAVIGMGFWSGIFCALLGLFKLAALVDFVSQPVLKGFAAASGILVSLHTVDR